MNSSNDAPNIDEDAMFDIVSFIGNPESNNNHAVFQFQKEGDSRLVTLRATNTSIDTTATKIGTRVMLYYTPESGMHNIDDLVSVKNVYNQMISSSKNPIFWVMCSIFSRGNISVNINFAGNM